MKRLMCLVALVGIALLGGVAGAATINVDVYSGYSTSSGGGAPYTGYVGNFTSTDVMFATNTGFAWHPFGLPVFGADITGYLSADKDDLYSFGLWSDDGSLLFIDGALVLDNGGPHPPTYVSNYISLTAGIHSFEIQFYEDFGGESGVDLYLYRGLNDGSVVYADAPVPEPGTMILLGSGLVGLVGYGRRRLKK